MCVSDNVELGPIEFEGIGFGKVFYKSMNLLCRKSGVTLTSSEVTGCLTVAVIHLSMSLDVGTLMDPLNP